MKRRGLSTIVGATFFVIVMASTIGYVTYSLDLIDDLARQVDVKQDTKINRQNEEFKISQARVDGANEFNLTVTNTGNIPINITTMWAKNMTDPSWNQTKSQINKLVIPGQTVTNIGQGTGLVAMDSESYSLKLLTGRGNALETQIISTSGQPIEMSLFTTPSSPLSGQNVTLLYIIKNNLTGVIQSLVPQMTTTGTASATQQGTVIPPNVQGLNPGETTSFEYTYTITGGKDLKTTFTATVANAAPGNSVSDTSIIDIAPVAESAIQAVVSTSFGEITFNFRSFEVCDPAGSTNCESDSLDWDPVWELTGDDQLLYRVNFTNNGLHDVCLEERTALVMFPTKDDGSTADARAYFIRTPSTTTQEDPGAYTPNYSECIPDGIGYLIAYFGSKKAGETTKQKVFNADGIQNIFVTIFAAEDTNDDGDYDIGEPTYSQTLPYLGSGIKFKN